MGWLCEVLSINMLFSELARDRKIRYFLISFTDLFGVQRAKLVPAQSIISLTVAWQKV